MIEYRPFRNPDPPLLAEVWNASLSGSRITLIPPRATGILEYFSLAKPYFDPAGLVVAFEDGVPVGLVHAGFAANSEGTALDYTRGVICALGVIPTHRRQGIGAELLRRAEEYLLGKGAREILAGSMAPDNPFLFGLYGGCDSAGFLASDGLARPFFEHKGYTLHRTCGLYQRELEQMRMPGDPRFQTLRQKYDIIAAPYSKASWFRECVLGPVEVVEYRVQDKQSSEVVARALLWVMELFSHTRNASCVGMIDLTVLPHLRQQGLARYLLAQTLRHLREQPFDLFEARVDQDNVPGQKLIESMGFEQVETGHVFRRVVT